MVFIFEDEGYNNLLPLVYTRPVFELRCGNHTILERIKQFYPGEEIGLIVRDYIGPITKEKYSEHQVPSSKLKFQKTADKALFISGRAILEEKIPIEGEEEIGSVNLPEFVKSNRDKLAADACVWEFGGVDFRDVPMQYLGMRGICYLELTVKTAEIDVHSGTGGSIFPNPAWRLVWALNSLKDQNEQVKIPGYYDPIKPPLDNDREMMAALPDVADEYKTRYGVKYFLKGLTGGVDLRMAEVFEPTCTICGLTSGYQGAGTKTVLPARASAKVDFRLVPDQTPELLVKQLRAHLDAEGFSDIEITYLGGEPPARTDPEDPFVKLVVDSAEPIYGKPMEIVPMIGGSGPNHAFIHYLNLPVVTAGVGYPGSQAHAPNENLRLDLYLKGAKHITRIMKAFAS